METKLLVCAPHTDDAELGCGGSIAKLVQDGWQVLVVAFSNAEQSIPSHWPRDRLDEEMRQSLAVLGVEEDSIRILRYPVRRFAEHRQHILDYMLQLRRDFNPSLVMLPAMQDVHQDHIVVQQEGIRAFRNASIWGYELPWNHITTETTGFVSLTERHLSLKLQALMCYESQRELDRPYFRESVIRGLAAVRGVQIKQDFAEAYQVIRSIL